MSASAVATEDIVASAPATRLLERGLLPDWLIRLGIRRLVRQRLAEEARGGPEQRQSRLQDLVAKLRASPIAVNTADANEQHYELPTEFFTRVLGRHLKYSCCYYAPGADSLDAAEAEMLRLTTERSGIRDGERVLELGCGWGSLTLWMAEQYPGARIVAVSNSTSQRAFILARAAERGLDNVSVLTADVGELGVGAHDDVVRSGAFDRVISVEMLEHVRNHRELGRRIARWLRPGGELFVHVFAHRDRPYLFEVGGTGDWMARHFFTGGMMPSEDWIPRAMDALEHLQTWRFDGRHYTRTLAAWRGLLEAQREETLRVLGEGVAAEEAERRWQRWRVFLIACEELFAARRGREWGVVHHRFRRVDER